MQILLSAQTILDFFDAAPFDNNLTALGCHSCLALATFLTQYSNSVEDLLVREYIRL